MEMLRITLEGLTPLLMHNPSGMTGAIPKRKMIPTPEQEAAISRYLLEKEILAIPTAALRSCIIAGARSLGFRVGKASLYKMLAGTIVIEPEDGCVPLLRNGKPFKEYSLDIRRSVVQGNGVLRSRAKVELPWAVEFDLQWDEEMLPGNFPKILLEDILPKAGKVIGLLDFRPACPKGVGGWFGKFAPA